MSYYVIKAHYYTNLVEGGHTIQGDVLIEECSKRGSIVGSTLLVAYPDTFRILNQLLLDVLQGFSQMFPCHFEAKWQCERWQ